MTSVYAELNGVPVADQELAAVLSSNYGHFTAFQVRGGAVRGLESHLVRLRGATRELFGCDLPGERVLGAVRRALDGTADASVRVSVHRGPGAEPTALLVTVRPPAEPPGPQSLMSVPYLRPAAHLKHLGGFGQAYFGRLAQAAGFDDALLTGPDGLVAEGAVANVGFLSAGRLVWPDGPQLAGTGMGVLEGALAAAGRPAVRRRVLLADVASFDAAVLVNSWGVWPVTRIDDTRLPAGSPGAAELVALHAGAPWDVL